MMKTTLRNTVSVLMALLVLLSTSSFTVDKHFCGGVLMDMAVLAKAEHCAMNLHNHLDSEDKIFTKETCCSNESTTVEGQDELKPSLEIYDLDQVLFLCGFPYSYFFIYEGLLVQEVFFYDYSPPLLIRDVCLQNQVFLI